MSRTPAFPIEPCLPLTWAQAKFRGHAERNQLRADHGIYTKALAGAEHRGKLYRPKSVMELKMKNILKVAKPYKAQSFQAIMRNQSVVQKAMDTLRSTYAKFDKSGRGIGMSDVRSMFKAVGVELKDSHLAIIFVEAFAPTRNDSYHKVTNKSRLQVQADYEEKAEAEQKLADEAELERQLKEDKKLYKLGQVDNTPAGEIAAITELGPVLFTVRLQQLSCISRSAV